MSYCRWSDDGFRCDLYCYAGWDSYVTHVARSRYPEGGPPRPTTLDLLHDHERYREHHAAWSEWSKSQTMVPIGLSFDGQTFHDTDLESFLSRVLALKDAGYRVPDYVAESIREEMAETPSPTIEE